MILKSIIKKIFVAAFALLVFQQVWAEENSENRTAKVRVLVTPGGEWKGKFPPQFALMNIIFLAALCAMKAILKD